MKKTEIPDFNLLDCCGSGGYGDVWVALDRNGLRRAVKVLDKKRLINLGVLSREEKALKLFRTQVPRHPNLVEVIHVGETDESLFYVMELADNFNGEDADDYAPDTLDARIRARGPLLGDELLQVIAGVISAVAAIHSAGLVHRDIKPSNIIFVRSEPRLADIGLTSTDSPLISVAGTPGFMPPEGNSGMEADIYSLGKLLYCTFTGRRAEDFPSLPENFRCMPAGRRRDLERFNRVALAACAKNPAERLKTALEFRSALFDDKMPRKPLITNILRKAFKYAALPVAILSSLFWILTRHDSAGEKERSRLMRFAGVELQRRHPDVALTYLDRIRTSWPNWAERDEGYFKLRDSAETMKRKMETLGGESVMKNIVSAGACLSSDPKRALELMEKLWKSPDARKQAAVISTYAMALDANGRFDEAVEVLKLQTRMADGEDADGGYASLASLYAKRGMLKEALANIDILLEKYPDSRVYLSQKAMILLEAGKSEEALKVFHRILEIVPDDEACRDMIRALEEARK